MSTWSDEFRPLGAGIGRWAPQFVKWGVHALDGNGDKCWKVHGDWRPGPGVASPAEMGLTLHEVSPAGTLKLYAHKNPNPADWWGYGYLGGMISGEVSHAQTYGTWECRAKFEAGKGQHWAMWLLQQDGAWPPEIDLVEVVNDGTTKTQQRLFMGAHGASGAPSVKGLNTDGAGTYWLPTSTWQGWHVYKLRWTNSTMEWWVDGVKRMWRPNFVAKPLCFFITPEIASNWPGQPDASTPWPMTAEIDYVRISA